MCLRKNYHLFLRITHCSYFKYNGLLHTLNVYKILPNEHHVVDSSSADEVPVLQILFYKYLENVPLILRNFKKLKRTKIARFKVFLF